MFLRRALSLAVICLAIGLVAPGLAPTVEASTRAREMRALIEVVHTEDAEPTYVAEVVRGFAEASDGNVRLTRVADAGALLDAIRASDAAILIVAAHGSSDFAGAGSGVLVGGMRVPQADLLAAVGESGARRFFFAACGLDLPEEVAGRVVRSFAVPIDMKLAAVEALSEIGMIYSVPTQEHLVPEFTRAIQGVAPIEELFMRYLAPVDPLRPDDGEGYDCYADDYGTCEWDRIQEERIQEGGQREGGGVAAPAPELTQELQKLVDAGLAQMFGDGAERYGTTWTFLFVFDFKCKILFDVMDLVVPGYSQVLDHLPEIKGVKFDMSLLRVEICGQLYMGMNQAGGAAGGGQVKLQIGSTKLVEFKFGWVKVKFNFYIGVIIEATGLVEDASGGTMEYIRLNFQLAVYLLIDGSWGWGSGTVRFDFLNPPFQRGETFRNPFANGNAAMAGAANAQLGVRPIPSIEGSVSVPVIESRTDYMVLPLTEPAIRALQRNPELAARLSEATGTDFTTVAPGTMLNLGNPEVHRALYGDAYAGTGARTLIQTPLLGASTLAPVGPEDCVTRVDTPSPTGGVGTETCASASTHEVLLQSGASVGGVDADGFLMSDPVTALVWQETYHVGSMRACRDVQDASSYLCQSLAAAIAAHSIGKSRMDQGAKASIRVRLDVDNAAAFVDLCADLFADNPVCVPGSAGVAGLAPAGGQFDSIEWHSSVVGPGGAVDSRVATALRSFGPTTAAGDTTCLVFAFDPTGAARC